MSPIRTARRWYRRLDHYYWLTAFLAARGVQRTTSRLIAAMICCLGAIPLVLLASPAGAQGPANRLLAVTVGVCCVLMALGWLRQRWPSRTESVVYVVTGTACVAVSCLVQANPVAGFLGASAFAVLSAYVSFLHTARLLAFVWTVAIATLAVLAVRLAAVDIALAVCSVLLVALIKLFVTVSCQMVIQLIDADVRQGEIEPLTGLLNRDTFYQAAATLLGARSRGGDRHLVIAVVNIDSFSLLTGAAATQARVDIGRALRENLRRSTIVAHVSDAEFMLADIFASADPTPLVERIRSAIITTPQRLSASIGAVCTPLAPLASHPSTEVLDELLTIATTAMYEARRAGGNHARCVTDPALAVLEDPDTGDWPEAEKPA